MRVASSPFGCAVRGGEVRGGFAHPRGVDAHHLRERHVQVEGLAVGRRGAGGVRRVRAVRGWRAVPDGAQLHVAEVHRRMEVLPAVGARVRGGRPREHAPLHKQQRHHPRVLEGMARVLQQVARAVHLRPARRRAIQAPERVGGVRLRRRLARQGRVASHPLGVDIRAVPRAGDCRPRRRRQVLPNPRGAFQADVQAGQSRVRWRHDPRPHRREHGRVRRGRGRTVAAGKALRGRRRERVAVLRDDHGHDVRGGAPRVRAASEGGRGERGRG